MKGLIMKYHLLSDSEIKAMDALKEYYGGAKEITETIEKMRKYETRKRILEEKDYGEMIEDAERLVKKFPKVEDFERENNISYNSNLGVATAQVSGWQGDRKSVV